MNLNGFNYDCKATQKQYNNLKPVSNANHDCKLSSNDGNHFKVGGNCTAYHTNYNLNEITPLVSDSADSPSKLKPTGTIGSKDLSDYDWNVPGPFVVNVKDNNNNDVPGALIIRSWGWESPDGFNIPKGFVHIYNEDNEMIPLQDGKAIEDGSRLFMFFPFDSRKFTISAPTELIFAKVSQSKELNIHVSDVSEYLRTSALNSILCPKDRVEATTTLAPFSHITDSEHGSLRVRTHGETKGLNSTQFVEVVAIFIFIKMLIDGLKYGYKKCKSADVRQRPHIELHQLGEVQPGTSDQGNNIV